MFYKIFSFTAFHSIWIWNGYTCFFQKIDFYGANPVLPSSDTNYDLLFELIFQLLNFVSSYVTLNKNKILNGVEILFFCLKQKTFLLMGKGINQYGLEGDEGSPHITETIMFYHIITIHNHSWDEAISFTQVLLSHVVHFWNHLWYPLISGRSVFLNYRLKYNIFWVFLTRTRHFMYINIRNI